MSEYSGRLYRVSLRILEDPQDAEDAVQDTFLRVFQSIGNFRGKSSFYTWLYRIATNESLQQIRKRRGFKFLPLETDPDRPSDDPGLENRFESSERPDRLLESQELRDFLRKCIDELPEHYRGVYILKEVEKLSEKEVCRILRISRSSMKNRAHRARVLIRRQVQERFFASGRRRI